MTTTILDEYIRPTLLRYIDQYQWSFSIAAQLINMYYGTDYTQKQLKELYKQNQKVS